MFQETENLKIIYIQETEAQKKVFIFQEVTFPARKKLLKSFLYLRKWNFLAPSLKNFLYIRKEVLKLQKQIKNLFQRNF